MTRRRRRWPTSWLRTTYPGFVSPRIGEHPEPSAAHCSHWRSQVVFALFHEPTPPTSVDPTAAVPASVGAVTTVAGSGMMLLLAPLSGVVALPLALVPMTRARSFSPASAVVVV